MTPELHCGGIPGIFHPPYWVAVSRNLCFHFAGSGENLPDIAKSRDASMGRKQNSFLFRATSCHFSVEVFPQITNNLSAGGHCQRDIKEAPLYECQRISA